jgi:hypothetical protein
MGVTVIPEKRVFFCDFCGKEGERPRDEPEIQINRHALDFNGQAVASANKKYQPCRSCMDQFDKCFIQLVRHLHATRDQEEG